MTLAMFAVMGLALAGCSKSASESVVGTYEGTLAMTVAGQSLGEPVAAKVIVTEESDDVVKLTMPGMEGHGLTVPDFTVSGVSVAKADKVYTLSKKDFSVTVEGVTLNGTIDGTVADKKLTLAYSVQPGGMPMGIACVFTSK